MIGLTVLGSTGSIGISTLDVVARHPDLYRIVALTANRDVDGLYRQCLQFRPDYAVMAHRDAALSLEQRLKEAGSSINVLAGVEGLEHVASMSDAHYVMAAIVGAAGLLPTLAAARAGKRVLLANKEALVVAGELFMQAVEQGGAEILPIDSEHNAVFQCMPADFSRGLDQVGVSRILLTASGGPFRTLSLDQLQDVTPDQACAHPNWDMGRKISVDSATMMNKGLEVIEACCCSIRRRTGSRWCCIRKALSTPWLPIRMARCSRNWAIPICVPRSPMLWRGRSASNPGWPLWTCLMWLDSILSRPVWSGLPVSGSPMKRSRRAAPARLS